MSRVRISLTQPAEKEPYKAVQGIAFSPEGSKLVVTAKDGVIRVWDIATAVVLSTLVGQAEGQAQWINDAVFLERRPTGLGVAGWSGAPVGPEDRARDGHLARPH